MLRAQKTLQDLELRFTEKSSYRNELVNSKSSSTQMHQSVNVLFPQVYQILIDCVRRKSLRLRNMGEEKHSVSRYTRSLKSLFDLTWSSTRRKLAQTPGEAPAPSPSSLSASPSPSPAPSVPQAPTNVPASPPTAPFFLPDVNSNSRPTAGEQTSTGASDEKASNHKSNKRTVVIAVVVTASVTLVIVAVLFIFCRRCCGFGPGRGKNDERPLLSLSISDYSICTISLPYYINFKSHITFSHYVNLLAFRLSSLSTEVIRSWNFGG